MDVTREGRVGVRTSRMSVQQLWYGGSPLAFLLLPFSWVFALLASLRRLLYRVGVFSTVRVGKPVIVVGNITVGGVGKTPLVIWLTQALQARGMRPAVVARGYGGAQRDTPLAVTAQSDAQEVGDEAVLVALRTGAIVVVCPDRVRAAQHAIELGADIIVSDDGLQHYRLARGFEIAVLDDERRFGNGFLLPAGPLRESSERLATVDAVVRTVRKGEPGSPLGYAAEFVAHVRVDELRSLTTGETRPLDSFAGQRVHAIAGIGHPDAFFAALRARGLQVDAHPLPDHAHLTPADVQFADQAPVVMTEKDAVKCRAFAHARCWVAPARIELDAQRTLLDVILRKLDSPR